MIAVFLPCAFGLLNADTQRDFINYCMEFFVHNFDVESCIVIISIRILTKDIGSMCIVPRSLQNG